MTTTTIASATATEPQRFNNSTTPEATNFFIIACSILGVFVVCTGCCCISLRYRKRRMQRIMAAAFEQGLFQHAEVGERVNALRNDARVVQVEVKETEECPQFYEVWQHETAEWPATSTPITHISRPPAHWSEYKPISASVSDPNAIDSRLSGLPVETQLAYLFHAKVQLKREWKRGPRLRGSVPPYKLKYGQKPQSLHPHQSKTPPGRPHLTFSVLIAMPVPPDSLSAIPAASDDLMLGVASAPYDDTNDKTGSKQTKA